MTTITTTADDVLFAAGLTVNEARRIAGGKLSEAKKAKPGEYTCPLSKPSKMPCHSWNIPAAECNVGGRLRDVEGSTCSGCYAMKGHYVYGTVQAALYRKLAAMDDPLWPAAMETLIRNTKDREFRLFDSGDLQNLAHFAAIVELAHRLPEVTIWLPTRERRIVREFDGEIPPNLVIRFSMPMVGMQPPSQGIADGILYSATHYEDTPAGAVECPATVPGAPSECGDCRQCWNRDIPVISYRMH